MQVPKPPMRRRSPNSLSAATSRIFLLFFAIGASSLACVGINKAQFGLENLLYAQISEPAAQVMETRTKKEPPSLELEANAALSMRINTGVERFFYKKNTENVLPIASLTKIMTATVILENPEIYPLDRVVTISPEAAAQADVPVHGNLKPDEAFTVGQLLHLMLFYSSNDAAYALSEVAGYDEFVFKMNQKAMQLGLENTRFSNPHGLDQLGGASNLSTADDLFNLVKYVLEAHPLIFKLSITPAPYVTENGLLDLELFNGQTMIGGKTGYTFRAGGCMVAVFKDEKDRQYIDIILGAVSSESRVVQMQKLINYTNNIVY